MTLNISYWDQVIPCSSVECDPVGHTRFDWHQLGLICARCNKHTGNENQGHYWRLCKRLRDQNAGDWKDWLTDFHFCCPDDCELGES